MSTQEELNNLEARARNLIAHDSQCLYDPETDIFTQEELVAREFHKGDGTPQVEMRRLMFVVIKPEALLDIVKAHFIFREDMLPTHAVTRVVRGLPADTVILDQTFDELRRVYLFLCQSEAFAYVPWGFPVPEFLPVLEQINWQEALEQHANV